MCTREPLDIGELILAFWALQAAQNFLLAHPEFLSTPAGLAITVAVCLGGLRLVVSWCASGDK